MPRSCFVLLLVCLSLLTPRGVQAQTVWERFEPCAPHNSLQDESQDVIRIGKVPGLPYVVLIPGDDPADLQRVRQCVPDALILKSGRGTYIQAGAFNNRVAADYLQNALRQNDLDARVVYNP